MKKVIVNIDDIKEVWESRDQLYVAIVENDGAIKWELNGHYLMDDTMRNIRANGFTDFSVEATRIKREKQNDEFIAEYRKNHKTSEEEKAEMRASFGTGVVVVDILTGERIKL